MDAKGQDYDYCQGDAWAHSFRSTIKQEPLKDYTVSKRNRRPVAGPPI